MLSESFLEIEITKLYNHKHNPRQSIKQDLEELADSITESGLIEPLLVRPYENGYQIISGHRRRSALERLGFLKTKCIVREMSDEEAMKILMTANIQRKTMSEIEEAHGIKRMIDEFEWNQTRAAQEFGKTQAWVSFRINLIKTLSPEIQEKVITRVINPTQAREIAQAPVELQTVLTEKVINEELSTRETEKIVKVLKDGSIPDELKLKVIESPHIKPEAVEAISKLEDNELKRVITKQLDKDEITVTEINHWVDEQKKIKEIQENPPQIVQLVDENERKRQRRKVDDLIHQMSKMLVDTEPYLIDEIFKDDLRPPEEVLQVVLIAIDRLEWMRNQLQKQLNKSGGVVIPLNRKGGS